MHKAVTGALPLRVGNRNRKKTTADITVCFLLFAVLLLFNTHHLKSQSEVATA